MGDRANVIVREDGDQVILYTHNRGTDLPKILRAALERGRGRWPDAPYLARIIFCEMVKGKEMEETGFGISGRQFCDAEKRTIVVDVGEQTVKVTRYPLMSFTEFTLYKGTYPKF